MRFLVQEEEERVPGGQAALIYGNTLVWLCAGPIY